MSRPLIDIPATEEAEQAYQDLCAALGKAERSGVAPATLLAISAKLVGRLIAAQDPFKITPAEAMTIVAENLKIGNVEMMAELMKGKRQ